MVGGPADVVVVATPIGNLGDVSHRAALALGAADFWVVEDTRVSAKLQTHLGVRKPMRSLTEHSTALHVAKIADEIAAGSRACLLTDGGAPAISDPGAVLVDECHRRGLVVDAIPGPSAVIDALMLSGFFAQRFCFLGFLGRKSGAMRSELSHFAESPLTLVLFESPFRIEAMLTAAAESLGDRRYAICREMTKLHQQVYRNRLPNLPSETEVPRKGEFTVAIEGKRKNRDDGSG